jgi:glycosyltransferase involved in cell wall biosynthesis|tara:strand:- start:39748 stop:40563 length:816 start_codon:yes stop_codon:yes gene_type:complete
MDKKTSVIIPYYHNEEFIVQAIESIEKQTQAVREIIIVNDGPTKSSRAFLATFSNRVTIVEHAKNRGIAHARNTGVKHASGEYVAFLDADDVWYPEKIALQENYLNQNLAVAACHTGTAIFKHELIAEEYCLDKPAVLTISDCLIDSHVLPSTLLIRRAVFNSSGGFDPSIRVEDYDFWLVLLKQGHEIHYINQALTWFRRAGHGNESGKWQYIYYGRLQVLRKHWRTIYEVGGILAIAKNLQRTFELACWRAPKPRYYIFRLMAAILPSS